MLSIQNKKLFFNNQPLILKHADSPESRLKPGSEAAFLNECRLLSGFGINCITATMYGDDVTQVFPWTTNSPSSPIDTIKLIRWRGQLQDFLMDCESEGFPGVLILYLGERTNWNKPTQEQYFAWIDVLAPLFESIQGHCIFGWEEIGQGTSMAAVANFTDPIVTRLKQKMPGCLTMLHNNSGQKPWTAAPLADIMCIQETSATAMDTSALAAYNAGYAVHLHEWYNGFRVSNSQSLNLANLQQLLAIGEGTPIGYGIFAADYDTQTPDPSKLAYLYQALGAALPTIPNPPTPNNMITGYSTRSDRSDFVSPIPTSFTTGPLFVEARQCTAPVTFSLTKDGAPVKLGTSTNDRIENGAPYDMFGGPAFNFTSGNYVLTVKDKTGATITSTFSVGGTVQIPGCMDPLASNYNPNATVDDGSCVYPQPTKPTVTVDVTANLSEVDVVVKINGVPQ